MNRREGRIPRSRPSTRGYIGWPTPGLTDGNVRELWFLPQRGTVAVQAVVSRIVSVTSVWCWLLVWRLQGHQADIFETTLLRPAPPAQTDQPCQQHHLLRQRLLWHRQQHSSGAAWVTSPAVASPAPLPPLPPTPPPPPPPHHSLQSAAPQDEEEEEEEEKQTKVSTPRFT